MNSGEVADRAVRILYPLFLNVYIYFCIYLLIGLELCAPSMMRKYTAIWVKNTMHRESIQWTRMVNLSQAQAHELESNESESFGRVCCVNMRKINFSDFVSHGFKQLVNVHTVIFVGYDDCCEIENYCLEDTELEFPSLMVPETDGLMFLQRLEDFPNELNVRVNISSGELIQFSVWMYTCT